MESLRHIMTGYIQVQTNAKYMERFLNLCGRQNIEIWNLKRECDSCIFYMERDGWEQSKKIQEKIHIQLHIVRKGGLPFFLWKYKKQKLLLLGLFSGILILFGLSQFVWEIKVVGNKSYTKEDIIKYVEAEHVPLGMLKMKVDGSDLEECLRQKYKEIAWVSCSLDGCRLTIHIKETLDKNISNTSKKPCDLIASKSGVITSIVTRKGTPLVKKGSRVRKGDVLISGNIYIFSDSNEVLETHKIVADGTITAKTRVNYQSAFCLDYYSKKYEKYGHFTYAAYICGHKIPLMPAIRQKEGMDQSTEYYPWKLGKSFYLPICIERTMTKRFNPIKKHYTKTEALQRAKDKQKKTIRKFEKLGVKVLDQNINIEIKDGKCTAKGYMILEEAIGKIRASRKLTKEQEKLITPTEEINW